MHNLKEIRKDFDAFKKALEKRPVDINFDKLKALDEKNRDFIQKKENLEKEKKEISKSKDKSQFTKSKEISSSIEKISNQFVKNVTNNINNFAYNKIIANFHEMYSSLNKIISNKIGRDKLIENYKKILFTMNPVLPHFSSECLELIGEEKQIMWPKINENFLIENKKNFIIQINGKTRGIIVADKHISEEILLTKINDNSKFKNYIEGKTIKKKIFIPEKLINIIVL